MNATQRDENYSLTVALYTPHFNSNNSHSSNSTTSPNFDDIYLVTAYVCCFLAIVIFLLNTTVLLMFLLMPSRAKQKTPNLMFGVQAVVDIVVAVTAAMTCLFFHPNLFEYNFGMHATFHFLFGYLLFLAPGFLLLTSGERFLAIRFPLRHRRYLNKSKLYLSIQLTFVINTIPSVVFVCYVNFSQLNPVWNHFLITTGLIQFLEIITVYALLVMTHRTIKNSINEHITQLELLSTTDSRDTTSAQNIVTIERERDLRITRILFTTCTLYAVTFVPIPTSFLIRGISGYFTRPHAIIENIAVILFFFSAWINPIITLSFIEDYREIFMLTCKRLHCPTTCYRQQNLFRRLTSVMTQSSIID